MNATPSGTKVGLFASPPLIFGDGSGVPWSGPLVDLMEHIVPAKQGLCFSPITFEHVFGDRRRDSSGAPDWYVGIFDSPDRRKSLWFSRPLFHIPVFAVDRNGVAWNENGWSVFRRAFVEAHDFSSSFIRDPSFAAAHPQIHPHDYSYHGSSTFPPEDCTDSDLIFGDALMLANRFEAAGMSASLTDVKPWRWASFCFSTLQMNPFAQQAIDMNIKASAAMIQDILRRLAEVLPVISLIEADR